MVQLLLLAVCPAGMLKLVVPQVEVKPAGRFGVSVNASGLPGGTSELMVQVDEAPGVVRVAGVQVTDTCGKAAAAGTATLA